jgi:hypothetical protein
LFVQRRIEIGSSITTRPFGRRAPREPVGRVVHVGGLAQEQRVELGDVARVVVIDQVRVDPLLARRAHERAQRLRVGRRVGRARVREDREVVAVGAARARRALRAAEVLLGLGDDERAVALRDLAERDRPHRGQVPLVAALLEARAQHRHRKLIVQRTRERVIAFREVAAEVDRELELLAAQPREALLDQILELLRDDPHDRRQAQVLERLHGRERPVTARRREQRDVVAERLVAVGAAQVVDAQPAPARPLAADQVIARRDDLGAREAQRPAPHVLGHEDRAQPASSGGSSSSRLAS